MHSGCYSGLPNATKQNLTFMSALIARNSSHMRGAIALHVDINTPYEQIISKMTQHLNASSQMKAAESAGENALDYLMVWLS